ncbi:phosphohistidine phosphatase SixA [Nibrella saemangeumensis]|uniref:Phosphohistidine phosphatase SixA n=1 Tax=Nibrella saemangeumensis TaxID=1084526 RepID=A0ABP8MHP4_9BACT
MKKTLYLVRHAKAEDRAPFMRDHDRELVSEGIIASARIGRHLREKGISADCLISSTALRAKDTARIVAEQLSIDPETINYDEHMFDGGPKAYLAAVNRLPADCQSVMLFGHNPDITYFAEFLTHQDVGSMSKGAVAAIEFTDIEWGHVSGRTGNLLFYIAPKHLKEA